MITEIKKGDRFVCEKSCLHFYTKGVAYESDVDGYITDNNGNKWHLWNDIEKLNNRFKLVSTKIQTGLDMPARGDFQNYSKEFLDNMQELQAVCDARSKDELKEHLGYVASTMLNKEEIARLALEGMNGGSVYMEKSYIKTGIIDVDKDLRYDLDPKLIRRFKSGAVRGDNTGRVRPDWISPYAIEEISKVLIENANDFGACNYFLGIDEEACLESMARHIEELKEAILITKDMTKAKVIARSVGFNAVAMLHTMVLKEKRLYKEHFDTTNLVTVEEAKKSNSFVG